MRVLLDACILYPTVLREVLVGVAQEGGFEPLYSERLLAEWIHAAARAGPQVETTARAEAALFRAAFPQGCILPPPGAEECLSLPDPGDLHVLAAAIEGQAEAIATVNLKDFPTRTLGRHGMVVRTPDSLLLELLQGGMDEVARVTERVRAKTQAISGQAQDLRRLLKRAGLPRLGKAVARA
ncbi:MAG: PIN domain-containing protein [Pseudomonadota bacterium]